MQTIELWGGHECSVNRVGDAYFDQTVRSGHHVRASDLDLFASLGVKALRYPVLWERVAPDAPDRRDWTWSDLRLARCRALGMRPIVGLLHHGAGPRYTNLADENFARVFADFTACAARRYPWVEAWTPVNEPLTTARFSALYGLWHPHLKDEGAFWRCLLNEIDATRLAMREIRAVNGAARLVQTEDLGRTYATAAVSGQASYDNERRWMTWDLLFGRVTREHPFWERLSGFGLADRLAAIADDPCPPDVVGVDHYLTSDRFLDHRTQLYPVEKHGGAGAARFADIEAVRVADCAAQGLEGALREVWARYRAPVAVTESFNGSTRDEQMRWFAEAWATAERVRAEGADIRAVTAWALLGAHDWNSLLTRADGHYESGAYDVRGGAPRRTALADVICAVGEGRSRSAIAEAPGWWRRDVRLQYPPVRHWTDRPARRRGEGKPLLILGATGALGSALAQACVWRGLAYCLLDRSQLRLGEADAFARLLAVHAPWAVINAAGWARVDAAERDPAACYAVNAAAAASLAKTCSERDLPYISFSTHLVFDGDSKRPYRETDRPNPLSVYGRSKRAAEEAVLALPGPHLIIRTAALFSAHEGENFATRVLRELSAGRPVLAANDTVISPTYTPDLADATLDLVLDGATGLWHLTNGHALTWGEFGRRLARRAGLDANKITLMPSRDMGWRAARPGFTALDSDNGKLLPDLGWALDRFVANAGRLARANTAPSLRL